MLTPIDKKMPIKQVVGIIEDTVKMEEDNVKIDSQDSIDDKIKDNHMQIKLVLLKLLPQQAEGQIMIMLTKNKGLWVAK